VGFLIGRGNIGAASVALRFEDGSSIPLRLTPDRFFLALLSGRRTLPGHQAVALVARDRAGRVLGRQTLKFFAP
jgi:hypothetical protein